MSNSKTNPPPHILFFFIFGIFIASYIFPNTEIAFLSNQLPQKYFILIFLTLSVLFAISLFDKNRIRRNIIFSIILVQILLLGVFRYNNSILDSKDHNNINHYLNHKVLLEGTVSKINLKENSSQIVIDPSNIESIDSSVKTENPKGKIQIITDRDSTLRIGEIIEIEDELSEIENFSTDFNYVEYLEKDNIYAQFIFPEINQFDQSKSLKYAILRGLNKIKNHFDESLNNFIPNKKSASLTIAMSLGDKQTLDQSTIEDFQKTGLSHIIAISGMHIGIITVIIYSLLLNQLHLSRNLSMIITSITIISYIIMIGLPASAIRASIMGITLMIAVATGRRYHFINSILLAASIILFINPRLLKLDLGFQLSFLSLLGLYFFSPKIQNLYIKLKKALRKKKKPLPSIQTFKKIEKIKISKPTQIALATISAQLGTLFLTIPKFGLFAVYAPIANILVLPILPFLLVGSISTGIIALISPTLASAIGHILSFIIFLMLRLINFLAELPGSFIEL